MANFAAADQAGPLRIIKRKLKKIQYRPHLIHGCLAATGLKIEPWLVARRRTVTGMLRGQARGGGRRASPAWVHLPPAVRLGRGSTTGRS